MSNTRWTLEQQSAIDTRDCNLLVAAAAGAGKTAVLVERIIKKITDENRPIDIDKLLVVTFTNAAASEMRERIGDAISRAIDRDSGSRRLQKQLTLLNKSSITTIHSFCLEVIKNNFHLIDLDPNFRIGDETECTLLKQETLEEMFDEKYREEEREDFISLVESYSGSKDDSALLDMVLNLYEFSRSTPWPEKWLLDMAEEYNVDENFDFGESILAKEIIKNTRIEIKGLLEQSHSATKIINFAEGLEPYLKLFQEEEAKLTELLEKCDKGYNYLFDEFRTLEFKTLPRCSKDCDKISQDIVKGIRDGIKKRLKSIKEETFFSSMEDIRREFRELYPLVLCLSKLVIEFGNRFTEKKREKGLVDFNDIEHLCLQILIKEDGIPSDTAKALRDRYEEILIDEYQDSNLVQEVMLTAVSKVDDNQPNMFMVGDVKQSIYRFRQAKPELFLEKYNSYALEEGELARKILLYKNFRSRKEVVDGVNFIFKQIMSVNIGELEYDSGEALNPGATYENLEGEGQFCGGELELHIVEKAKADEDELQGEIEVEDEGEVQPEVEEEDLDAVQVEARLVSKRIKELIRPSDGSVFMVYDKGHNQYRPVQYRDIVILMRATSSMAPTFMEELTEADIPVYADAGTGYFNTTEVKTMLSLLQIIDNPLEDVALLSVLRSPIGDFNEEDLIEIRIADGQGFMYDALVKRAGVKIGAKKESELGAGTESEVETEPEVGVETEFELVVGTKSELEARTESESEVDSELSSEVNLVSEEEDELGRKCLDFLSSLELWRRKALLVPIHEFIWYLYIETGYYAYVSAMPGGVQREANLRLLFERAKQYEETSYKGLFNFINYINKLKKSSNDLGSAKILGENENVVRIMSIHKSKGLEFPVTIVAGCGRSFNMMDLNRSVLFHQTLGFGFDYVDFKRRLSYPSIAKEALKKKIKLENLSEEMRILYVAFTRAREKLIIVGSVKDFDKCTQRWSAALINEGEKLPEYEVYKAKNYLDWICPSVLRHRNCGDFRELANTDVDVNVLVEDESNWQVKYWTRNVVLNGNLFGDSSQEITINEESDNPSEPSRSEHFEEVHRRLEWEYKYKLASSFPTKLSVTELKRRFNEELDDEVATMVFTPTIIKRPSFLEEERELSGAERGTLMHLVMQQIDLSKDLSKTGIQAQVEELITSEMMTEKQAKAVRIDRIEAFFKSSLGKRMLSSNNIKREIPFFMELKCSEVYREIPKEIYDEDTILLQGIIDCFFEEDGEIVLLDYKTDYVENGDVTAIKERYRVQLDYYQRALEKMTGMKVKEKYIYLFSIGQEVGY